MLIARQSFIICTTLALTEEYLKRLTQRVYRFLIVKTFFCVDKRLTTKTVITEASPGTGMLTTASVTAQKETFKVKRLKLV